MIKKVNYFTVDLCEKTDGIRRDYREIKDLVIRIIEKNAVKYKTFLVLDLTMREELHYVADIFEYENNHLFMRVSSQKPSGGYLHRDYETNIPTNILEGVSEDKEGIEVYTYALLDYETGIFSIVNQQSAPGHKKINNIFARYSTEYFLDFKAIPNPDGISRIYEAIEPKISQIEIEVPVPNAAVLEEMFGWSTRDILNVQGNRLKATMKISSVDRQLITENGNETRGLIDCIRLKLGEYNKARVRARAEGEKTRDYNFYDENFSYPIDIPSCKIISGEKFYYSADQLVQIYLDNLRKSYEGNKELLKIISDR